jgi:cytochrome c oxidase assembly protein subunit 15
VTGIFELRVQRHHRVIAFWLLAVAAMVFAMVVIGGVTRLTHSGLSMVDWRPATGWLPPFTEAEWRAVFQQYQQFPEYREVNAGMTLAEFKGIFWLEFIHRLWGRLIGVAFAVPLVVFLLMGWVDRRLAPKLVVMFVLGGLQGVLGWYMVKSGLVDRPDVSQYRLTAHLGAALLIYAYMLWVAFGLLAPNSPPTPRHLSRFGATLATLVFVTALSGGLVAGLDAGFAYNTFPLMDGELIPEHLFAVSPLYLSFFEDVTTVQFTHRLLALTTAALVVVFWFAATKAPLAARARLAAHALLFAVAMQVTLGIATLVLIVPVPLAAAHQAGAVVLLTAALWAAFEVRQPRRETPAAEGVRPGGGVTAGKQDHPAKIDEPVLARKL